jgi:hypothetical protein
VTSRRLTRLVWLFAPLVVLLAYLYPPFIAPDDDEHFARAYIASRGELIATQPGGYVDAALVSVFAVEFWHARDPVKFRTGAGPTDWTGREVYRHSVAAYYLPILYAPQVVAIWAGRGLGLDVQETVRLARIANGLSALGLLGAAVASLPEALGTLVLTLMALPRTMLHFASNSADGLLLALCALLIALTLRLLTGGDRPTPWVWVLAGLGVVAIGGVRPPLVIFGAVTGWAALRKGEWSGLAISVASVLVICGWWAWVMPRFSDGRCGSAAPLTILLGDPLGLLGRTIEAHGLYYLLSFVGEIGWGSGPDGLLTPLPAVVYVVALIALLLAAVNAIGSAGKVKPLDRAAVVGAALVLAVGVMVALAVACTKNGSQVIGGVQGRYFVQPLLLIGLASLGLMSRFAVAGRALVVALPMLFVTSAGSLILIASALY